MNSLSSSVISKYLDAHHLNQGDLGVKTGISRTVISAHLSGQRAIRDEHLSAYLGALGVLERPMLLSAWLRDTLPVDVIHDIFRAEDLLRVREEEEGRYLVRLKPEVIEWTPQLDEEQRDMLLWWVDRLIRDPDLDGIFRQITRKAGYTNQAERSQPALVITDAAGLTIYLSPAQERLCGYTIEQMRGRKPGELLQGPQTEPEIARSMSAAINDHRAHECTITNHRPDGAPYQVHIRLFPVYDSLGTLIQFRAIEEIVA